jgi:glycine/D-amino acid oxidase-like deaminating enzyme
VQSKKPGIHLELARASLERYPGLADELELDIEFEQSGCLVVIEGEPELKVMKDFATSQSRAGNQVQLLDTAQARELEPLLARDIFGATFNEKEGQVSPIKLTLGLAKGAEARGAAILTGQEVVGFIKNRDTIQGVKTRIGEFKANAVVNACGVLAPQLAELSGLKLPITPRRGQLLVTEAQKPLLKRALLSSRYIAAKFDPGIAAQSGGGCAIEQTASGNFLLGSTREFAGYNTRTSLEGLFSVASRVSRIIPGLKDMRIIRSFAGLRPYTPDGLPVLGAAPGLKGLFIAAGHEGDGIALAPITGHLMTQLIMGEPPDFPLDEFSFERLATGGNGEEP